MLYRLKSSLKNLSTGTKPFVLIYQVKAMSTLSTLIFSRCAEYQGLCRTTGSISFDNIWSPQDFLILPNFPNFLWYLNLCTKDHQITIKRIINYTDVDTEVGKVPNRFIPRGDRRPAPFQQLNHWACDAWELLYAKRPPENNVPKQLQHHALDLKLGMLKAFLREDIYIVAKRYTLFEKLKNPMSQSFVC